MSSPGKKYKIKPASTREKGGKRNEPLNAGRTGL
jgi:hypothetical protein